MPYFIKVNVVWIIFSLTKEFILFLINYSHYDFFFQKMTTDKLFQVNHKTLNSVKATLFCSWGIGRCQFVSYHPILNNSHNMYKIHNTKLQNKVKSGANRESIMLVAQEKR